MKIIFTLVLTFTLLIALLSGCAVPEEMTPGQIAANNASTSLGSIEIRVTDAPRYDVSKVLVYFAGVSVHKANAEQEQEQQQTEGGVQNQTQEQEQEGDGAGEWIDIPIANGSFDLVALGKAELEGLLATDNGIEAGKYTQIRVTIDEGEGKGVLVSYTDDEGVLHEDVPARLSSGVLKFVQPFDVVDGNTTIITIDFDIEKSVTFAGHGNKNEPQVMLKPVVKLSVTHTGAAPSIISVSPVSGTPGQTLDISITGTGLNGTTDVSFGEGITVNSFTVDSGNQVTVNITIAADATPGTRSVSLDTTKGTATLSDGFTVT